MGGGFGSVDTGRGSNFFFPYRRGGEVGVFEIDSGEVAPLVGNDIAGNDQLVMD